MTKTNKGNHTNVETTQNYLERKKNSQSMTKEVVLSFISEAAKEQHSSKAKQYLIMFAVDTALRMEELLSIRFDQFKVHEDFVEFEVMGMKNRKITEKISHEMYSELLELKNEDNDLKVFAELSGKNVSDMMIRISRNLGYSDDQYTFHSFKKTAVSFSYKMTGSSI